MKKIIGMFVVAVLFMTHSVWADAQQNPRVRMETNRGVIVLELDPKAAPKTVENFLEYVQDGFFDGTIFHRVIKKFMVQGGGFTQDMRQKPTREPIANEADNGLKNLRGTVAMARTSNPHSATAQFFINTVDNGFLDNKGKTQDTWGYCVFGKVVEGMNNVDVIENLATTTRAGFRDVPASTVIIEKAVVVK